MTRKALFRWTAAVIGVYAGAILLGIVLRVAYPEPTSLVYPTYRDLIPLLIALPAAFLAYGFQRRASYLQGLRTLWGNMVGAMAAALTYTELPSPSKDQYAETLRRLSSVIEEVRGFYRNVPAGLPTEGWYPFEPVKQIYDAVRVLGFGEDATAERRADAQDAIYDMWKRNRAQFLTELDVAVPTHHHAAYAPPLPDGRP
jgi:hypothetical protein